jgi:hypothetical protein
MLLLLLLLLLLRRRHPPVAAAANATLFGIVPGLAGQADCDVIHVGRVGIPPHPHLHTCATTTASPTAVCHVPCKICICIGPPCCVGRIGIGWWSEPGDLLLLLGQPNGPGEQTDNLLVPRASAPYTTDRDQLVAALYPRLLGHRPEVHLVHHHRGVSRHHKP